MKNLLKYLAIFAAAFAISGAAVYFGIGLFTQSADEVILPELKGKNIIYVLGTLTEMGLNVKLYGTEYHETVPKYSVIAQDPEPGSTIKKGRDVIIYLSKGEKRAVMPDLRGMELARAEILLEKNDFLKQRVTRAASQTVPSGHVIAQYPRAFSTTPRQTRCSLLVSSGPRPAAYVMPDLRGLPMETAGAMLSRLQVPLEKIQSQKTRDVSAGQVIRQMPENGGRVTRKHR